MTQEKLNELCDAASGGGVGFVGRVDKSGAIFVRRDEEYARSTEHLFESDEEAVAYLEEQR